MIKKYNGSWSRVLYTKIHGNRTSGSKEQDFKAFQNIWAWKPSGHVTNIFISSYLKVYIQNFVKEGQVVSSLSSEIRPFRQICHGQSMVIIYTKYDRLDVDATYQVSCKSVQWFWRII